MKRLFFLLIVASFVGSFSSALAQFTNPQDDFVSVSANVFSSSPAVNIVSGGVPLPPDSGTVLIFRGYAYPGAFLTLTKNGTPMAGAALDDASFELALPHLPIGTYNFSLGAKEIISGDLSPVLLFSNIIVDRNSNIIIAGIFFPPTLHADKSEVLQGESIRFVGRTAPGAEVSLTFSPSDEVRKTTADPLGYFAVDYNTANKAKGVYQVQARSSLDRLLSSFSNPLNFKIGEKTVKAEEEEKPPIQVEVPLYPHVVEEQPLPVYIERPEADYSLTYLWLLLIPILLMLLERKREYSFGVIPVSLDGSEPMFLVIQTNHGDWGFPKGHRERGEAETDTALRELWEETGIKECLLETSVHFTENYKLNGKVRHTIKINKYFLGFIEDTKVRIDGKEILDYKWGTFGEAFDLITHDNAKKILIQVRDTLKTRK